MKSAIVSTIRTQGPMPFDAFMERCLYDTDGGFFTSGRGTPGRAGDFVTSPEVSDGFGIAMARWVAIAAPSESAPLVEVGAGSGALLNAMGPMERPVYAVERSRTARRTIAQRTSGVEVVGALSDLPPMDAGVVIANELLDNLPSALARRTAGGWIEVGIGVADGELAWVDVPPRPEIAAWCTETFPDAEEGTVVTAQRTACAWITDVIGRFTALSLCVIDYAATSAELGRRSPDDLVRGYRRHTSSENWLATPGETDITVDVNTDAIVTAAQRAGATTRVTSQRQFLIDNGALEAVERLLHAEHEAARQGLFMDQLVARSDRIDLEALLDPSGLGSFTVFLITKGPVEQ